ncbi:MAG: hypothetical protein MTP17_01180 [Candidatus Midichloria sp.]|nr:MAG: hypothetical protein MTP17_01180 [Candidatus Midichloria sp.]
MAKARESRLKELISVKEIKATLISFETAKKLLDVLRNFYEVFGNRRVAVACELTKIYEEVRHGDISEDGRTASVNAILKLIAIILLNF